MSGGGGGGRGGGDGRRGLQVHEHCEGRMKGRGTRREKRHKEMRNADATQSYSPGHDVGQYDPDCPVLSFCAF